MTDFCLAEKRIDVRGRIYIEISRDGEIIEVMDDENLIVNGSKTVLSNLLGGNVANNSITQIGFGTNGTAPVVGNTALTGAFVKSVDSVTYPSSNIAQFNFSLGSTEDNGMSIAEFGLLTAGNTLFCRRVRGSALVKNTSITLSGNWQISF